MSLTGFSIQHLSAGRGMPQIEQRMRQIENMIGRVQTGQPLATVPASFQQQLKQAAMTRQSTATLTSPNATRQTRLMTHPSAMGHVSTVVNQPVNHPVNPLLPVAAQPFQADVEQYSRQFGVDSRLVNALIQQESAFNPLAVSGAGAQGLMQLMPATAKELGVINTMNPSQNIAGGVKYLKQQLDTHHGNVPLALAAYNAGAGNVAKYGGIPPFKETQHYVKKVLTQYLKQVAAS